MRNKSMQWSVQVCTDTFIAEHTDLVRGLAHKYCRDASYIDDCIQEGFLALMRASELYNPEYGLPFRPYAARRIRGALARWQDNHLAHVRTPIHVLELQRRSDRVHMDEQSRSDASFNGDGDGKRPLVTPRVYVYSLDDASVGAEFRARRTAHEIVPDTRQPSPEVMCEARSQLRSCIDELREFKMRICVMRDGSRSRNCRDNRYDVLLWYYFGRVDGAAVSLRHVAHRYSITRAAAHQRIANTWRYIRKTYSEYSHRWVAGRLARAEQLAELLLVS